MNKKYMWFALLCVLWPVISLSLSFPRLTHPAFGIQGDLPLHYHITRSYSRSFAEGDLLPRWAGLLDGGRGDALFTFYPPLSYLLSAALIKVLGIDVLTSLKLGSLLIITIAQLNAYLLARQFFNERRSLIVSLAFVMLPAFPLIALHRAFLANALALSLTPLALLGAHLFLSGNRCIKGLIIFVLSFSAIILTHAITTYLCGLAIAIMASVYFLKAGRRGMMWLAGALMLVFVLTAFFLWPQRVESNWIQISLQLIQQDYRSYFLFARAPDTTRYRQAWADLNYVTSLITIVQTLTAALLGLICRRTLKLQHTPGDKAAIIRFALAIAAFGLFISLSVSNLVWKYLPGLKFIQFPWRFQPFVSIACGLLAAASLESWKLIGGRMRSLAAALLTWVFIANCIFLVMLLRLDEPGITSAKVADLLKPPDSKPVTIEEGKRLQNEDDLKYIPYAANQIYFRPPGSDFDLYPPVEQPGGLSYVSGRGRIVSQKLMISTREFEVENEEPARVRIETYYYPHWVARLDEKEIKINVESEEPQNKGLMLIDLPTGRHRLKLNYEIREKSERIARAISLIAWPIFIGWMIFRLLKKMRYF